MTYDGDVRVRIAVRRWILRILTIDRPLLNDITVEASAQETYPLYVCHSEVLCRSVCSRLLYRLFDALRFLISLPLSLLRSLGKGRSRDT